MSRLLPISLFITIVYTISTQSSEILIRRTQLNDFQSLIALSEKIINEYFQTVICAGYPESPIVQHQILLHTYCKNMSQAFAGIFTEPQLADTQQRLLSAVLAHDEQMVVGFCFSQQISPNQAYIRYLIVDKKYRNNGIGDALLKATLDSYPHITSCELKTFAYGNDKTHRFYEKHGFISDKIGAPLQKQYSDYSDTITFVLYHLDIER